MKRLLRLLVAVCASVCAYAQVTPGNVGVMLDQTFNVGAGLSVPVPITSGQFNGMSFLKIEFTPTPNSNITACTVAVDTQTGQGQPAFGGAIAAQDCGAQGSATAGPINANNLLVDISVSGTGSVRVRLLGAMSTFATAGSGTITGVTAGTGLTGGGTSGGVTVALGSVIGAGSCTSCNLTYNAQGQVTVAANGSGGGAFQTNGTPLTSTSTINFLNSAAFNGLTITFANPSTGQVQLGVSGTLGNAGLTNPATTVNGQLCTLGSACTVPFQTNGVGNTSQAGINLLTSTANSVGLTITPVNSATNAEKFEITGASYTGNAATATLATSATTSTNLAGGGIGAIPYQSAGGTTLFLTGNTAATDQVVVSHGTGAAAQAPTLSNAPALSAANMTSFPTLNQSTSGNAATATTLASVPTNCGAGSAAIGILANGNATGCFTPSGGTPVLSGITAAGATNSIGNANFAQTWNWSLTGATNGFNIGESSASTGSGSLLKIAVGASSTATPLTVSNAAPQATTTPVPAINITSGFLQVPTGSVSAPSICSSTVTGICLYWGGAGNIVLIARDCTTGGCPATGNQIGGGWDDQGHRYCDRCAVRWTDGALVGAISFNNGGLTSADTNDGTLAVCGDSTGASDPCNTNDHGGSLLLTNLGVYGKVTFNGSTSGSAAISVAAIAGTPATWLMPVTDPTNGQLLAAATPSGGKVQLSWTTGGGGVAWQAIGAPSGNLSLSMGSNTSAFNTTTAVSQFFAWKNTTAAVIGTSQSSPTLADCGTEFHAAASAEGCGVLQFIPGTGTDAASTFAITHTGSATGAMALDLSSLGNVTAPNGALATPGIRFAQFAANSGLFSNSATSMVIDYAGVATISLTSAGEVFTTGGKIGWSVSGGSTGTIDTTICRQGAGVAEIGSSTGCAATGGLQLTTLAFVNATSGTITLQAPTGALGAVTVTIPDATDTLVNLAGTQTLTNKSIAASEINSGTLATAQGGTGVGSPAAHSLLIAEGASAFSVVTSPSVNGFYACGFNVTGSAAVDTTCSLQGVAVNTPSTPYTGVYSDRASYQRLTGGTTFAYTLPQVTGNTAANMPFVVQNGNSGTLTFTADAADKIDGSATGGTSTVLSNFAAFVYQDASSAPGNWWTIKFPSFAAFPAACGDTGGNHVNFTTAAGFSCGTSSSGGGTPSFPVTVAGTVISGGIPYFSSTTVETSSALLTANSPVLGGGAGAAPKTVAGITSDGASKITLGVAGTSVGAVIFNNATSGAITLQAVTGALGTVTISLPAAAGTVAVSASSPITESAAGALACATCVTSAASLTTTALMTGAAGQASQTPSATSTLDGSGNLAVAAGGSLGSADTGAPKFTFAASKVTLNQPLTFGTTTNQFVTGTTTNLTTSTFPASSGAVTLTFPNVTTTISGLAVANTFTAVQTFGTNISIGGVTAAGATGTSLVVFNTTPLLVTPKVTTINDANGNPFLISSATASAVDSITITNAATANPATVTLASSGSDTNINLSLAGKGTGQVMVGTGPVVTPGTGGGIAVTEGTDTGGVSATFVLNGNSADHTGHWSGNNGTVQHLPQVGYSASSYTNATTTFSSVTGLSFTVAASAPYAMECHLYFQSSAGTAGIKAQITGPASPTAVNMGLHQPLTVSTYNDQVATAFSTSMGVTTTTSTGISLEAVLTMGLQNGVNAGTIQVQLASEGTGTLTLNNESYCKLQ